MSVFDAMQANCAVRSYTEQRVDKSVLQKLLHAAVQAPTAMRQEPWSFVVIEDKALLDEISSDAKQYTIDHANDLPVEHRERLVGRSRDSSFDVFYGAPVVIAIYGKPMGSFVGADCWLAAENILLGASELGMGACVIGLAVGALDQLKWKERFGLMPEASAYAVIALGHIQGEKPAKIRKAPDVAWV